MVHHRVIVLEARDLSAQWPHYLPRARRGFSLAASSARRKKESAVSNPKLPVRVVVSKNGPYLVSGGVQLVKQTIVADNEGGAEEWQQGEAIPAPDSYALCRCGKSGNKPFCDGTHKKIGFDGTEIARRSTYREQAQLFAGPALKLTDAQVLCAAGRFCDPNGTVWKQVERTDDAAVRATFLRQVHNCPSGRLVAWDQAGGQPVEDPLPVSIGIIEDPSQDASGPLWLRGGIPVVSADGFAYEIRNRQTLCRCGASKNKPFCDGSHLSVGFRDWT
jgi:CDGSH-type Zn-finger protein